MYPKLRALMLVRLLCVSAGIGAYLCSSGLLRLNEVFFQHSQAPFVDVDAHSDQQTPEAVYDRLVIVLIDALRADMVLGSAAMRHKDGSRTSYDTKGELNVNMPFTSSLVTSGRALGYVAHASVPTVTMPRLKALMTGKAPAFIDILKNFHSVSLEQEANLMAMLKASGKRIVFYGDDTWLKLFPETFKRSDGTSGFYTRDTVEVDTNVTRHLKEELDPFMQNQKSRDWDVLVLHYLGLDHVGHLRGPRSSLMTDKLQEMDHVMKVIYESIREQDLQRIETNTSVRPTLVLLCSDHGMSEVGNHGGATLEESSALFMFLRGDGKPMGFSQDVSNPQKRSQMDLVPTISSLFGLAIPMYSTGLLLDEVVRASFDVAADRAYYTLRALYHNFQQLYTLAKLRLSPTAFTTFDEEVQVRLDQIHKCLSNDGDNIRCDPQATMKLLKACEMLQDKVTQSDGSEYDLTAILMGLGLLLFSMLVALTMLVDAVKQDTKGFYDNSHLHVVLGVGSVLQIASLSSSSSIENEHATTFFMTTSLLFAVGIILLRRNKSNLAVYPFGLVGVLLVITRTLRARNQIINFWRLNGLKIDANLPGNEFATDDSVSILSTAPMLPSNVVPFGVCIMVICGVVIQKAVLNARASFTKRNRFDISVGIGSGALFLVGMLACHRVKKLSDQTTIEQDTLTSWTGGMDLDTDSSARVVYACILSLAILTIVPIGRTLRSSLVEMVMWLLVALVQRGANLPTLCILCLQMKFVAKLFDCEQASSFRRSGIVVAGLMLWLSQGAFFALGNSHLVTTIDISQSYHGLSSYSQSLVGALTFTGVFSGPLVCFVNLHQLLNVAPMTTVHLRNTRRTTCLAIFTYQTLRFAVYTIVVYLMRFHLFIWSVFAPKMLYEFVNLLVALVLVVLLL